ELLGQLLGLSGPAYGEPVQDRLESPPSLIGHDRPPLVPGPSSSVAGSFTSLRVENNRGRLHELAATGRSVRWVLLLPRIREMLMDKAFWLIRPARNSGSDEPGKD